MTDNTKNKYATFAIRTFVFFTIVFVLDLTIGKALHHFYFKQESGLQYRTTYSMEKTKADLLIFGSSRANHHYQPEVLEEKLKMNYYNVGRDGNFIFYHYAILKSVLKRYKPKVIVLDFVEKEFEKKQESYDRLSSLLPYYNSHPEIKEIVELKSPFEKVKLISNIYPYNSSLLTIAVGNTKANKKRKQDNKGYIGLTNTFKEFNSKILKKNSYDLDTIKVNCFKEFLDDCITSGIKTVVVCSPYYYNSNEEDQSIFLAKEIAAKRNINFYDFSKDTSFVEHPFLFADKIHLNESGAKKFSSQVADKIVKQTL